jgi:hypothetical protein
VLKMQRERWCRNCRGWHRDGEWPRACSEALYGPRSAKSELPLPFVRRDHMDGVKHPRNGTIIESRSEYDRETKEYLAENPNLVELGTEKATSNGFSDSDDIKSDVITAMKMVEQGYKPETGTAADATNGWTDPA